MTSSPYKALFEPFKLGHLTLKNRIISTCHAPAYAEDGIPGERYQRYHEEKARGGLAMTMFGGASSVSKDSPPSFGQLNVSDDRIIPHFRAFANRIHAHDVPLICQLSHAGRRTRPDGNHWLPTVAPSALREPAHGATPKIIEPTDIRRIVADYAAAAKRCSEGGLDGIELLASGHLIGQFWSPLSNTRSDNYGGTLENRLRFGMEVLEAIRDVVRKNFIVSLRFTANEFIDGGITEEDGIAIGVAHAQSGLVDCLNVSGAANWTKAGVAETVPSMAFPAGRFVELAGKVRWSTGLPVLHAAGVADLATANFAVSEGHVDLIGMTRAQIADPHMVRKHLEGKDEEIRPCVGAGYCIDRIYRGGDALCLHNAVTGREGTFSHETRTADTTRKVVIVGAGPAGLEAARVCAERGHKVALLEAQSNPGGQIVYAARIPWRQNMIGITRWLYDRCVSLGVEFRFNTYAEADDVLSLSPNVVILATGGLPESGQIIGGDMLGNSTWDILSGEVSLGKKVLVYDETGGQSGPTVAEYIAGTGSQVDLMTPDRMIAEGVGVTNHAIHLRNLYGAGVNILPDWRLLKLERNESRINATIRNEYSAQEELREYEQVVIETGTVPMDDLYDDLASQAVNGGHANIDQLISAGQQSCLATDAVQQGGFAFFRIGDCVSARGVHAAMLDANRICKML
ncbi:putative N-methylproline demethylase [Sulfitobacter sp. DSM 110093]|uniref:NADH:flavin oxidoreductase n=1 Tax=Sulfitobacter sp. DSM 110093 TaxID=2883127 RepID=UPI001FAC755B|nr:NADH:flavin oxidoreductase [Sulfitobacter sp. DSM 110093]UOA32872.1 putative N-methylproline demethylase [Sulfitobacter sp. DSM 110093]